MKCELRVLWRAVGEHRNSFAVHPRGITSSQDLIFFCLYRSRFLGHKYCHLGPDLRVASLADRRS